MENALQFEKISKTNFLTVDKWPRAELFELDLS